MRKVVLAVWMAAVCGPAARPAAGASPYLVKDIDLIGPRVQTPQMVAAAGRLFFRGEAMGHQNELWTSDGTPGDTRLLAEVPPGCGRSGIMCFAVVGDRAFFLAHEGEGRPALWTSASLWTSDGTEAGTHEVRKYSSPKTDDPSSIVLVAAGDRLFFAGFDPATGTELWTSDGTADGTRMAADIAPGPQSSAPVPRYFTPLGSRLIFWAIGYAETPLWVSDGTPGGTLPIPGLEMARTGWVPIPFAGKLFFDADDPVHGDALWTTDGTPGGTRLVADIPVGPERFRILGGAAAADRVVLSVRVATELPTLWTSDGTAAGTVKLPSAPSPSTAFASMGGKVYFSANDGIHGMELWVTDGSAPGTSLVKDIRAGSMGSNIPLLVPAGSRLFFPVDDGEHGIELWASDGTTDGTRLVRDIALGAAGSSPTSLTVLGAKLCFYADDGLDGWRLWVTDGTEGGTMTLKASQPTWGSYPLQLTALGGKVYFPASEAEHGRELWASDGTADGTALVKDVWPGPGGSDVSSLLVIGDRLVFWVDDGEHDLEPWVTDGTAGGTRLLSDISSGPGPSVPSASAVLGGRLYFWIDDGTSP